MSIIHSAYLRPVFTASLTTLLLASGSIHLISPHGQGRRRMLQDLHLSMASSLQIFHMNMRSYKHDYKNFINDFNLYKQDSNKQDKDFNSILKVMDMRQKKSLIILHNFDELRSIESIDEAYNSDFFKALNNINMHPHIALLCVSENEHSHYRLQADGHAIPHSGLDAESLHLPELTHAQIIDELKRRALPYTESELHECTVSLLTQTSPYSALKELFTENISSELAPEALLNRADI